MKHDVKTVAANFKLDGTFESAAPYGSGHINDTYLVKTVEAEANDYIFQRVNHNIFKNVPKLQENIARVIKHIGTKLAEIPGANVERETLTLIETNEGEIFHQDEKGEFWRVYIFISNTNSYDIVDSPDKAFEGGKAFGRFQLMLADIPGGPMFETILNFHNIESRLEVFFEILKKDPVGRAKDIKEQIQFVEERAEYMKRIVQLGREGKIPTRITHNDTKFNNVLLTKEDKGLCVIDLDTVMTGYVHYDFGDSIRTSTNTGAEDDKDLSKVTMNIELFEAYARGFLGQTKEVLTQTEIDNLAFSAKMLTFMIGLRFITDYVDGDNYFKTHHQHHNLQRAKAQFKLVQSMEEQYEDMKRIVKEICKA